MGATFPIMQRCLVNGQQAHPIFKILRKNTACFHNKENGKIKNIPWNFTKFIIDAQGTLIMYQNPRESLYNKIDEIECVLGLRGGPADKSAAIKNLAQTLTHKVWIKIDKQTPKGK